MNEITILKKDMAVINDLVSGYPYKNWCKENKHENNIHTKAQYILDINANRGWNTWFREWVNSNEDWLVKVKDGCSLRIIMYTISTVKFNDSDIEKPMLTNEPLSYEGGDYD